jgi:hypothetical protein
MAGRISSNVPFLFSAVVIILVLCFFAFDGTDALGYHVSAWTNTCCSALFLVSWKIQLKSSTGFPDFNHYDHFTHTLSNKEFPTSTSLAFLHQSQVLICVR